MIDNAAELSTSEGHETALSCLSAGIEAAHPRTVIRREVGIDDENLWIGEASYPRASFDRLIVVGGGKASGTVALELEAVLGGVIDEGVVVAPDPVDTSVIEVVVGEHPVPSDRGVAGARRVLDLVEGAGESTLVLAVITGGGSALLPAPATGISLDDLQAVTNALIESGATIHEINAVRKHLSAIKGGGLARAAAPARVVSLIFSDVVGNDLDVIASGPTAPDGSTFADASAVLARYDIEPPAAVRSRLDRGREGGISETPRAGDPVFERVRNHVLADGYTAVAAASKEAQEAGYEPCILSSRVRGEAREAAKTHVAVAEEIRATGNPVASPSVVVSGGETTVTVTGDGEGGPNQEFVVSAGLELGVEDVVVASVDTDGRDGATAAAGGIVDYGTITDPEAARAALAANDVYAYLGRQGARIETGPTGTNVNDLRVLVID